MHFLDWIFIIVAILVIILSLLQGGKSEGASASIMGGAMRSYTNLKERGPEKFLSRFTFMMAGVFFFFAIIVRLTVKA